MDTAEPSEVISEAKTERVEKLENAQDIFSIILELDGMVEFDDLVEYISDETDLSDSDSLKALTSLTGDTLDPVQVISLESGKYVGVLDYVKFEAEGVYGFTEYDSTLGKRKVMVCAQCVFESRHTSNVFRCVEGVGRHDEGCSFKDMLNHCRSHYNDEHDSVPSKIKPAASLVSGTTIAGSSALHEGVTHSISEHEYTIEIDGSTVGSSDTINLQTQ